jgi:hypothetical protein
MPEYHRERDGFDDDPDEGDFDDDDDDGYETGEAGHAWPASGYLPAGFPPPPGRQTARRGWVFALTAVVAAAVAFGMVDAAIHEAAGTPAASATPSAGGSSATPSGGPQLAPQGGGGASLPSGAATRLVIGGPVTAVSATSITIGTGGQAVTATVTSATKVTGKVTSIGGIKVGNLVSATISGTSGKLVADSIQDPASLPSGPGQ